MADPISGPAASPESTPAPQNPAPGAPAPAPTGPAAPQPPPDATALQAELTKAKEERAQFEKRFTDTQAAFTRVSQERAQLAQLVSGNQPPPASPVDTFAKSILAKGTLTKDPEQARALAETMYEMVNPVLQQARASQMAVTNQNVVPMAMQAAFQADPQSFQDPEIASTVNQFVQQESIAAAQQGRTLDLESAKNFALAIAWQQTGAKRLAAMQQQAPPPPQYQQTNPFQNGAFHVTPGFQPPPQLPAQNQISQAAKPYDDELKKRYQIKP